MGKMVLRNPTLWNIKSNGQQFEFKTDGLASKLVEDLRGQSAKSLGYESGGHWINSSSPIITSRIEPTIRRVGGIPSHLYNQLLIVKALRPVD